MKIHDLMEGGGSPSRIVIVVDIKGYSDGKLPELADAIPASPEAVGKPFEAIQ